MTTDEARHDRQVCATFAHRWHGTGRIVSVHTERGPFLEALNPDDPHPVAIVQFEFSDLNPYSGQRVSIGLDRLTPRFNPNGDGCPICRARNEAQYRGTRALDALRRGCDVYHQYEVYLAATHGAHHAREYFRLIEEDHTA